MDLLWFTAFIFVLMKMYSFQQRTQTDKNGNLLVDKQYDVFDEGDLIGSYFSNYNCPYFHFNNLHFRINKFSRFFKPDTIQIVNQTDGQVVGSTPPDTPEYKYLHLLINERAYYPKSLTSKFQARFLDIKTWKFLSTIRFAIISNNGAIIYQTDNSGQGLWESNYCGYIEVLDETYLLDAFTGFYFLDKKIETMTSD